MKLCYCPYDEYDFSGREQWLSALAQQGSFIKAYWGSLFFMSSGQPEMLRFHIEPPVRGDEERAQAQRALFEDSGWTYLCALSPGVSLYCTDNPDTPAPYTDEESKADSLYYLEQTLRRHSIGSFCIWGGLLGFLLLTLLFSGIDWYTRFPLILIATPLILILWLICTLIQSFCAWQHIRKLRRALSAGLRPGTEKPRCIPLTIAYSVLCLAALAVLLFGRTYRPAIPELPTLNELEQSEGSWSRTADRDGYGSVSFWAPVQFEQQQSFCASQDASRRAHLTISYYRILPPLSRSVAEAEIDVLRTYNQHWSFEDINYPGTDFVISGSVPDDPNHHILAIGSGSRLIIYACYSNTPELALELSEHLDILSAPVLEGGAK